MLVQTCKCSSPIGARESDFCVPNNEPLLALFWRGIEYTRNVEIEIQISSTRLESFHVPFQVAQVSAISPAFFTLPPASLWDDASFYGVAALFLWVANLFRWKGNLMALMNVLSQAGAFPHVCMNPPCEKFSLWPFGGWRHVVIILCAYVKSILLSEW